MLSYFVAFLLAAVFPQGPTIADIQAEYRNEQVSILIVPGHDTKQSGAVYKGIKEADLTLAIANNLAEILSKDPKIVVQLSRGKDGKLAPWLTSYITEKGDEIRTWRNTARASGKEFQKQGLFESVPGVAHNNAPSDTVTYLYAINHYANEHDVDLVVHLHVNDEPRKNRARPGPHTGYAVYIPESQLSGSETARVFATTITNALSTVASTSTLPQESRGIVPEQELIAIGPWGTRAGPSLLIEYGYIFEPEFVSASRRPAYLRSLALRTAEGIQKALSGSYSK